MNFKFRNKVIVVRVRISDDALLDTLSYGVRYQLIELQRIGRRFNRILDEAPLLFLKLTLFPWYGL